MQIIPRAIPRSRHFGRGGMELSRAARLRLSWMDHYCQHGQNVNSIGAVEPGFQADLVAVEGQTSAWYRIRCS